MRSFAILALAALGLQAAPTRSSELLKKLDNDIGQAMSRTSLEASQARKLTEARRVVSELAAQRRLRDRYERDDLRQAAKVVRDQFKSKKTFREEDRKAVLDDLEQIKKAGLLKAPPARRGPLQRSPFPRNPYPRRLPLSRAPSVS